MAESYYPAPGVTEMQHERLVGQAMPSGLLGHPDDQPLVYADDTGTREIRIRASRQAVVEGFGWQNDAVVITKTLAANTSGSTRVDLVVLRLNRADWSVTVQVVQGTPGASAPSATRDPSTAGTGVYEIELATVTVANNATTLAASTVAEKAWYLGEGGEILCKSTTRPPHKLGRTIHEHPSSIWRVSDGTRWLTGVEDTGAATLTMTGGTNPWVASHNTVWRRNGWAFMQLTAQRTGTGMNAGTQYTVATIPVGFRPPTSLGGIQTTATVPSIDSLATVAIHPTGQVVINPVKDITVNRTFVISTISWPCDG